MLSWSQSEDAVADIGAAHAARASERAVRVWPGRSALLSDPGVENMVGESSVAREREHWSSLGIARPLNLR